MSIRFTAEQVLAQEAEALDLRVRCEATYREIAEALGVSVRTAWLRVKAARQHAHAARRKLRQAERGEL